MRVDIGDGVRLFVDVDGFGLVPDDDGTRMRDRPTIVAMHGGPGLDHVGGNRAPIYPVGPLAFDDMRKKGNT